MDFEFEKQFIKGRISDYQIATLFIRKDAAKYLEIISELKSALQREKVAVDCLKNVNCDHCYHDAKNALQEIERMRGEK